MVDLTQEQLAIIDAPPDAKLFLSGPAGCGKTTVGVERMLHLLGQGISANALLVLAPQRTLAAPYVEALRQPSLAAGGQVSVLTVGGLARRMVDLFWPLAAEAAGFAHPDQPPVFLTLETTQYYMAHLVRPRLDEGYFESVTIDRNRLYSQIIDNLNKSAAVGFPHTQIGERLDAAWYGDPAQRRVYADAQDCANRFRDYCLAHNLLDFSLQLDVFWNVLWPDVVVRDFLTRTYRHLIFDNLEEDTPRAHDLIADWLPSFDSALLIYDEGGGYRRFLGADPESGWALRELCAAPAVLDKSFVVSEEIEYLAGALESVIAPALPHSLFSGAPQGCFAKGPGVRALAFPSASRFYPQMLDWVSDEIARLISEDQLPPSEIVVLAPYLSDALRFSLINRLEARRVPVRSHRPSRSLRDEPATQALLTLAALAHPGWNVRPTRFDIAYAFMLTLNADLVRAQLLAEIVYRQKDLRPFDTLRASLSTFDQIKPDVQERITYTFGNRYSIIRDWLESYRDTVRPQDRFADAANTGGTPAVSPRRAGSLGPNGVRDGNECLAQEETQRQRMLRPLDHFLRKLFGEVLSQPGFGFHRNLDAARVAASLIESVKKFRIALEPATEDFGGLAGLGKEYIVMLQDGVIAAQYLEAWRTEAVTTNAVLIAPAHTFLMMNRPVTVQFWLDVGSSGWHERLFQPLTHPYVLSRSWTRDQVWSDADEVRAAQEGMARLVSGLLRRCRERVYLGLAELGETGFEQRGGLLKAFQKVLASDGERN
ncbi:MAG: hypothetical protein QMD04_03580 [Anaerolineales bacterium]|nr:hypothetical protein [Anaerolineales bacterium]